MTAVMSGEVQLSGVPVPVALPQVKAGKVKAYATTGKNRFAGAPDIPTVAETVPGYESTLWYALLAPAATPPAVIKRLHAETIKILKLPGVTEQLLAQGADPIGNSPQELTKFLQTEIERWTKLIQQANIRAD